MPARRTAPKGLKLLTANPTQQADDCSPTTRSGSGRATGAKVNPRSPGSVTFALRAHLLRHWRRAKIGEPIDEPLPHQPHRGLRRELHAAQGRRRSSTHDGCPDQPTNAGTTPVFYPVVRWCRP